MFRKGLNGNDITYPLTQSQIDNLVNSKLASPKVGKQHGLRNVLEDFDLKELTKEIEGVRFQIQKGQYPIEFLRKYYPFEGECPTELTQPLTNEGLSIYNPNGLANVVHMDFPTDMPDAVHKWLVADGVKLKDSDEDYIMFTDTILDVTEDVADGVKKEGNEAFEIKYFYGVSRPEENCIHGLNITAYKEGCPNHPSYPAGHGAIAGGSVKAFFKHFDLSESQKKTILDTAYLWAMFRSFAGVHYGHDNVAGLWLGLRDYFTEEKREYYKLAA